MAEKPKMPNTTAGAGRRKHAAPTIDLTATEVPPAHEAAAPPRPDPPPQPPPPQEPAAGNMWHCLTTNIGAANLAAGAAGAAVITLVLFALWLTGLVPIRYAGSTAMRARVAGLEMQMHDLKKRPASAADTKAIDELTGRVAKIEDAIGKIPASDPGVVERIAAADNAMKSLGIALAALNRRSDDIAANTALARERAEAAEKAVTDLRNSVQNAAKNAATGISSADLEALQRRIAGLEQSAKSARDEIAKAGAADTAARLALSAAALRDAVISGAPFAAALAQAKALGADEKSLAPLAGFAAGGVPTQAMLTQELRALVPGMIKRSGARAPAGGFLERLQANAGNLVRIRPVDAPPGDDASALLARIEVDAARADIAAALADLGKLPDATRAPASGWIKKAEARQTALAAANAFAAETARALGPPLGPRAGAR